MARHSAYVLIVLIVAAPPASFTQSADTASTWVGVAMSGEHARFSHSLVQPGISDIGGTQPTLSLRVTRLVTRHVGFGVDVDISRRHELVKHMPLQSDLGVGSQTFDDILTVHDRFTAMTAHVDYSTTAGKWTTTFSVGMSFTRARHSLTTEFVPPLPFPPPGFSRPTSDTRISAGPAVGIEVRRAFGERWSLFGDFRVADVSSAQGFITIRQQGFLLRPGFGIRLRL